MYKEHWILVSGSDSKFDTLKLATEQAKLGIQIGHLSCPKPVHELHGPLHTSTRYMYADKTYKTWVQSKDVLNDSIGIGNDVCPKLKSASEMQYRHTFYKYHRKKSKDIKEMGYQDRLNALSWYISLIFGQYKTMDPIDLRQSIGIGVFDHNWIYGDLIQKIYLHFPTNPLPSMEATRECLDYSAKTHVSVVDNSKDNTELETSVAAAGGILPISLLEWYLQTSKNEVVVDGLSDGNDLMDIEMLGRGFTSHAAKKIDDLVVNAKKGVVTARALAHCKTIPITINRHCNVVWSRDEQRSVCVD